MSNEKNKTQIIAGKLLKIVVNSIDLYNEDERKQAAKRRWTIARSKIKTLSSFKNFRKVKTTSDLIEK
jgi:hypothetical protein